jgi:hypothetical protein
LRALTRHFPRGSIFLALMRNLRNIRSSKYIRGNDKFCDDGVLLFEEAGYSHVFRLAWPRLDSDPCPGFSGANIRIHLILIHYGAQPLQYFAGFNRLPQIAVLSRSNQRHLTLISITSIRRISRQSNEIHHYIGKHADGTVEETRDIVHDTPKTKIVRSRCDLCWRNL